MKIKIKCIWHNDSGDVEIVNVVPVDESIELKNDLFWFSGNQRPHYRTGQIVEGDDFVKHKCYKQRKFQSFDDIPNDCAMSMF